MNIEILQGKWHQLKGSAKAQWGKLTDDELDMVDGQRRESGRPGAGAVWLREAAGRRRSEFISGAAADVSTREAHHDSQLTLLGGETTAG